MIARKLYGGTEDVDIARYTLEPDDEGRQAALRVYDVIGGDALVFLMPAQVRRLIADLKPFATKTKANRKARR